MGNTGSPARGEGSRFDQLASIWDDDPVRRERAEKVASAIRQRTSPGGEWLDYGAGTGALGLALLGHVERVTLADSSRGMREASRAKIAASGLGDRVRVLNLDLTTENGQPGSFDGVASLQVLHHVDDVVRVVVRLAAMVRPGGWLALADLEAEDGSFHGAHVKPMHHGFTRDQMRDWLTRSGLVEIDLSVPVVQHKNGRDYPILLALGRRGVSRPTR